MRLTLTPARAALWLLAITAAIAAAAVTAAEVAGALAGVIRTGAPVLVDPVSALHATFAAVTDPAGASRRLWPQDVRESLPGRAQLRPMLLVGALAGATVLLLPAAALRMLRSDRRGRTDTSAARLATGRDLRRLFVRRPGGERVVLGRAAGRLLAAETNASTLIVAPSQSHKTTGLVIPAILEWNGPLLATSVKGDLLVDTVTARARLGDVKIFDPMNSTGQATATWSPVRQATTWTRARIISAGLLQIDVAGGASQSQDKSFWRPSAQGYLAALIYAAHLDERTMGDVSRWIDAPGKEAIADVLAILGAAENGEMARDATDALMQVERLWAKEFDSRTRSSMLLTLSTALYAWGEHSVQDATDDDGHGITADWLLSGANTLYLVAPTKDQQRLQGMFSALIQTVVDEAFARSSSTGRAIDPRLLLVLDEAANTAPLPSLDAIASTGPGQGVTVLTVLQNLSQASHAWGRDKAQTIIANHRAKIFGAGLSDPDTLKYLETLLGDQAKERTSISKDRGKLIELGSRTQSIEHRKLLGPHQVRQTKEGHGLLLYGNLPPANLALRPWFKDRHLKGLSNTPVATAAPLAPLPPLQPTPPTQGPDPQLSLDFAGDELAADELRAEDIAAASAAAGPLDLFEDNDSEPPEDAYDGVDAPDSEGQFEFSDSSDW